MRHELCDAAAAADVVAVCGATDGAVTFCNGSASRARCAAMAFGATEIPPSTQLYVIPPYALHSSLILVIITLSACSVPT